MGKSPEVVRTKDSLRGFAVRTTKKGRHRNGGLGFKLEGE
jgi:hypothetical protein